LAAHWFRLSAVCALPVFFSAVAGTLPVRAPGPPCRRYQATNAHTPRPGGNFPPLFNSPPLFVQKPLRFFLPKRPPRGRSGLFLVAPSGPRKGLFPVPLFHLNAFHPFFAGTPLASAFRLMGLFSSYFPGSCSRPWLLFRHLWLTRPPPHNPSDLFSGDYPLTALLARSKTILVCHLIFPPPPPHKYGKPFFAVFFFFKSAEIRFIPFVFSGCHAPSLRFKTHPCFGLSLRFVARGDPVRG